LNAQKDAAATRFWSRRRWGQVLGLKKALEATEISRFVDDDR
jgi:hypothetical protein